jgi:eukaryotic-like serine/threonine-protein kinase
MSAQGIAVEKYCPVCGLKFPPSDDATKCTKDGAPLLPVTKDPLIGQTVEENVELLELIGAGASSMVYRARRTNLNQLVAFKLLRSDLVSSVHKIQRFENEARMVGRIKHPNVCAVFDFGLLNSGQPYLVLELVDGKSLATVLTEESKLPTARAIHLLKQIGAGLQEAHNNGVMHRDLKPSNIMVVGSGENETVKLIDFGLARALDPDLAEQLTTSGYIFGTPSYMSPEQVLGKPLDARTDIYSLGCVFYEMLTGKKAIDGDTAFDIMSKHLQAGPEAMTDELPAPLQMVVVKCMQKEPANRYQTVQAVLDAVAALKTSTPFAVYHRRLFRKLRVPITISFILGSIAISTYSILPFITPKSDPGAKLVAELKDLETANKLDQAEVAGKKTFDWLKAHGRAHSQEMIDVSRTMQRIYDRQARTQESGPYIKAIFEAESKMTGDLIHANQRAGAAFLSTNSEKEAVPYLAAWLKLTEEKYGATSKECEQPLLDLCHAQVGSAMYSDAEQNYRRLTEISTRSDSGAQPEFLVSMYRELADLYLKMNKPKDAITFANKAVALAADVSPRAREGAWEKAGVCAAANNRKRADRQSHPEHRGAKSQRR